MAKEVQAKSQGKRKPNFLVGIGLFFKKMGLRIVRSLKDMYSELKKVTWPTRGDLTNYTLVVIAFMIVMGIVVFAIDSGAAGLVQLITR